MANMLSQLEHFHAANYIRQNVDNLTGKTRGKIAEIVSKNVGFEVTDNNVKAIADMLGIADVLRGPHGRQSTGAPGNSQRKTLDRAFASSLLEIASQLGINLRYGHRLEQFLKSNHEKSGEPEVWK